MRKKKSCGVKWVRGNTKHWEGLGEQLQAAGGTGHGGGQGLCPGGGSWDVPVFAERSRMVSVCLSRVAGAGREDRQGENHATGLQKSG